ncbi:MAG: ABC transporter permease [Actinomycetota bacterium]|nr:ABC transporter permease [Actinomycetota bacterium]
MNSGAPAMLRLVLRRDRFLMPVWLLIFVLVAAGSASATEGLYPTVASRVAAAETANATPALLALYGRIYDPASLGGLAMLKLTVLGAVFIGVLMSLTVLRHTRGEEESGRLELMRAGVLGRRVPLAAVLGEAYLASVALGVLTALGLMSAGLGTAGSWAFGLSWACAGVVFASVAAVAAQLTESTRAATGLAMAVLAVSFVLRAVGDMGFSWLSWISPIGWSQQIRPFGGERWWVALIPLVFAVLAVGVAVTLLDRRDVGAGTIRRRPGPAAAGRSLRGPVALAWRLQRGQLLAWLLGFGLLGLVAGSIANDLGSLLDSPQAKDLITTMGGVDNLTDAFLSTELGIAAVLAAAYGIQATLRLRSEETAQRVEPVLATSVTRTRWIGSHLLIALGGSTALMLAVGLGLGVARGAGSGNPGATVVDLLGAALVRLPAVWVLTGLAAGLFGLLPRAAALAWGALVAFLVLGEFGAVLGLPRAVVGISPFAHVPALPGGTMTWTATVVLTLFAVALTAAGIGGFRRRDVG